MFSENITKYFSAVIVEVLLIFCLLKIFIPMESAHDVVFIIVYFPLILLIAILILLVHFNKIHELIMNFIITLVITPFLVFLFSRHDDMLYLYYFTTIFLILSIVFLILKIFKRLRMKRL